MTEHERMFWRRQHEDETDRWWRAMMTGFKREVPIELARLQFECAMELTDGLWEISPGAAWENA